MSKKNSGKKMMGKGVAGMIGGKLATDAILLFAPVCPVAYGAWVVAKGVTAASAIATAAGGVKSVYDKGYNDANEKNEKANAAYKAQAKRDDAMAEDMKKEMYEYIKIMKCLKGILNNHKEMDKGYFELILENIRKERPVFLKFYGNGTNYIVLNKIEKDFNIEATHRVIDANRAKLYMQSLLLMIRGIRITNATTRADKHLIAIENELQDVLLKNDNEFVEFLRSCC